MTTPNTATQKIDGAALLARMNQLEAEAFSFARGSGGGIRSGEYDEAVRALFRDVVIERMAEDLREMIEELDGRADAPFLFSLGFMMMSNSEYRRINETLPVKTYRAKTGNPEPRPFAIGSIAEAIRARAKFNMALEAEMKAVGLLK